MDEDTIREMLVQECERTLSELGSCKGAEAQEKLEKLNRLHRMLLDSQETHDKAKAAKSERNLKVADIAVKAVGGAASLALTAFFLAAGLKFEETGCFTSKVALWVQGLTRLFDKK